MKRLKSKYTKGFSLIELMVVVAIVGVLATVAFPNFQRFQSKARQAEAKSSLGGYATAASAFQSEWNTFASNWAMTGFNPTGSLSYRITSGPTGVPAGYQGYSVPACIVSSAACTVAGQYTARFIELAAGGAVSPAAPNAASAANTATTYIAQASGLFSGMATADTWDINQLGTLTNSNNSVP